jgi:hypothetical protein
MFEFFTITRSRETFDERHYEGKPKILMGIAFKQDTYVDLYTRTVYNIMNLFSDVGGVFNTLVIIGTFITSFISKRIMLSAMIEKICHVSNN